MMNITRRAFMVGGGCAMLAPAAWAVERSKTEGRERKAALCIYGATLPGVAAAVAAARQGSRVVLVEPIGQVGGLVTSGLSWSDFRTFESLSGVFAEFARRVQQHYADRYGSASEQVFACFHGTHGEPNVNRAVIEQMLADHGRIEVVLNHTLAGVDVAEAGEGRRRIERASFRATNAEGALTVRAKMFIDATYEGDLMAAAGVDYRIGRESRDTYGESLAPEHGDGRVQGFNFRYVLTDVPENRVYAAAPAGYDRDDFAGVLRHLGPSGIEAPMSGGHAGIFRTHLPLLPNRKADVNDTPHAPIRLSMPDINDDYPDGDAATRRRIVQKHRYYHQGLMYFLQNDRDVPADVREQARQWGLCKDEFVEHGHHPPLLYIREARRMAGRYIFTQQDTDTAENDVRSRLQEQSIGVGDYTLNCHGTGREGARFDGRHTGEFYQDTQPFQLPYGMIVPERHENLLVPVACSASHVGFSAIRLEPTWTALGHAAGLAAHLAAEDRLPVQDMNVPLLQSMLHRDSAKTIYVSDVAPADPAFVAMQQLGQRGAFHGLRDPAEEPLPSPRRIYGQYLRAHPGHGADLSAPLDEPELASRWLEMIGKPAGRESLAGDPLLQPDGSVTRGAFLMQVHRRLTQDR